MLKSHLIDKRGLEVRFEPDDLRNARIVGHSHDSRCGAIGANSVPNHCLQGIVEVVTCRTNIDYEKESFPLRIGFYKIVRALQASYRTSASHPQKVRSLYIGPQAKRFHQQGRKPRAEIAGAGDT